MSNQVIPALAGWRLAQAYEATDGTAWAHVRTIIGWAVREDDKCGPALVPFVWDHGYASAISLDDELMDSANDLDYRVLEPQETFTDDDAQRWADSILDVAKIRRSDRAKRA